MNAVCKDKKLLCNNKSINTSKSVKLLRCFSSCVSQPCLPRPKNALQPAFKTPENIASQQFTHTTLCANGISYQCCGTQWDESSHRAPRASVNKEFIKSFKLPADKNIPGFESWSNYSSGMRLMKKSEETHSPSGAPYIFCFIVYRMKTNIHSSNWKMCSCDSVIIM